MVHQQVLKTEQQYIHLCPSEIASPFPGKLLGAGRAFGNTGISRGAV